MFQSLKSFSDELKTKEEFSSSEGDKDVNKKKNRYKETTTNQSLIQT